MEQAFLDEGTKNPTLGPHYFAARAAVERFLQGVAADKVEPIVKKAADDFYSQLLDSVQSYLLSNAETELATLRNKIAYLERDLAIANSVAPSRGATGKVIADDLGHDGFPLNDRAVVTFNLPGGKVSCMLRDNGTALDLNTSGGVLHLVQRTANSAWIEVK